MKKDKIYFLSVAVGIALIVGALLLKNKDNPGDNSQNQAELMDDGTNKDGVLSGDNSLEGVLYKSEDLNRGNLKLISKTGDIYLRTSRDFSNLVGLQVLVLINGTRDNFELLDIQAKVADEGFIREQ